MPDKKIQFDLTEVERLAALGLNKTQIAYGLGNVSERTIRRRLADDEDFIAAFNAGRSELAAELANIVLEDARAGSVSSACWLLEHVCGFSKKPEIEVNLAPEPVLNIILTHAPVQQATKLVEE